MRPKFGGFDVVREGQPLADDRGGEITAPMSGFLLMPLYQQQGEDGFYLVRAVRRFWVPLSVARWFALQLLHLLGFKRVREAGATLYMRRRGGLSL